MTERNSEQVTRQEVEGALMGALNDVCPDCFDCGMTVTKVDIQEQSPLRVLLWIRYDPHPTPGEWEEDVVTLEYQASLSVLATDSQFRGKAIEAIGAVVDDWRDF